MYELLSTFDNIQLSINITELINSIAVRSIPFNIISDFTESTIYPGNEVWFAGYPRGFYDHLHNLPLLRHGYIASHTMLDFRLKNDSRSQPMFAIDAQIYKGSNGSPVFTPTNLYGTNIKFIGVVSETAIPAALTIQSVYNSQPLIIPETIGIGFVIKSTADRDLTKDYLKKSNEEIE